MKTKEGFVVKEIAGQYVVVALGEASKIFNGIIKLNESGKLIWTLLSEGKEKSDVVDAILAEYDGVDRMTAEEDFDKFVDVLKGANIIE